MKHEPAIRKVLALQKRIQEMQAEVSRILDEAVEDPHTGTKFVIDDRLWEVDRWPMESAITKAYFKAWCLKDRGPVAT